MIVLDESDRQPSSLELVEVESFDEEASLVSVDVEFQQQEAVKVERRDVHEIETLGLARVGRHDSAWVREPGTLTSRLHADVVDGLYGGWCPDVEEEKRWRSQIRSLAKSFGKR